MERSPALIVIGPDGTVLAATGDLPPGLVDVRLDDCVGLSSEIREAGKALLHQLQASGNRVVSRTVELDGTGQSLQLMAAEAVPIRRAATNVRTLLTSKLAVLASQAATVDMTLSVEFADDVPAVVQVDSEKVAWAITTLVGNALRYVQAGSPRLSGGSILVRTSYDRAASEITIEVRDDGPGVSADTVSRLFKRDGLNVRGSGLALLLISDVVAAHAGRVEVQSSTDRVAHGTTIRLTFPAG